MNILLTGGTGYIGSHTAVELLRNGNNITVIDNLINSKAGVIDSIESITGERPEFIELDLLDSSRVETLFSDRKFDLVIHFAGLKAVGDSLYRPLEYYKNNLTGSINLLQAMQKHEVYNIIFSSSATVYGESSASQYSEDLPTGQNISNPYGKSKYMIEEVLKDLCHAEPRFNVTILRYFNPIGAHDSGLIGEDPNGVPNNLLPYIAKVATGELPKVSIFGGDYSTPDGTAVRDYIHVVDLAKGHVAAVAKMDGLQVYNLGTGRGNSVLEVIYAFSEAVNKDLPYEFVDRRAGDLPEMFSDPSKAKRELGWQAERSLAQACKDIWRYQTTRLR